MSKSIFIIAPDYGNYITDPVMYCETREKAEEMVKKLLELRGIVQSRDSQEIKEFYNIFDENNPHPKYPKYHPPVMAYLFSSVRDRYQKKFNKLNEEYHKLRDERLAKLDREYSEWKEKNPLVLPDSLSEVSRLAHHPEVLDGSDEFKIYAEIS